MRLEHIHIENFLRLKHLDLNLCHTPIHLFAGANEAGKTSLQEAIRFALTGETLRVKLKKEYRTMLREGTQKGHVQINTASGHITRNITNGKVVGHANLEVPETLAYVLDAARFSQLDVKSRRQFLFNALGIRIRKERVVARLQHEHVPDEAISKIIPLLRSGFEAAHDEAKKKLTELKGAWQAITKEKYGCHKGDLWQAPPATHTAALDIDGLETHISELTDAIDRLRQEETALLATCDIAEGVLFHCPQCDAALQYAQGHVKPQPGNARSPGEVQRTMDALTQVRQSLAEHQRQLTQAQGQLATAKAIATEKADVGEQRTQEAQHYHRLIQTWDIIAAVFAPDGLPGEILAEALDPINQRLRYTADKSGWALVQLNTHMEISVDQRPYALMSESARWRADAALTEAIAYLTGLKLFILDRIDVLDLANRVYLVQWLHTIARDHDTILLMGTLKESPKGLPASFSNYWLNQGDIESDQSKAA